MSGDQERKKHQSKNSHLDQFPQDKSFTPWERAVLERVRRTALRHYNQRHLREEERRKEELFWQRFGAYESSEISKRRQNRHKKSPTRLERYEQLDEERYDRNIRHGIFVEDVLRGEERLKKRAERFGLGKEPGGVVLPEDKLKHKSLADYADTIERLEKRRARFAMEPREDFDHETRWRNDIIENVADHLDKERMLARKKRFGQSVEYHRKVNSDCVRGRGSGWGGRGRGRRRRGGRRTGKVGRVITGSCVEQGHSGVSGEECGNSARVNQEWEQEWDRRCESWETVDVGNMERESPPGRKPSTNREAPPDRVFVSTMSADVDADMQTQGLEGEAKEWSCNSERVLQSWESRGERW